MPTLLHPHGFCSFQASRTDNHTHGLDRWRPIQRAFGSSIFQSGARSEKAASVVSSSAQSLQRSVPRGNDGCVSFMHRTHVLPSMDTAPPASKAPTRPNHRPPSASVVSFQDPGVREHLRLSSSSFLAPSNRARLRHGARRALPRRFASLASPDRTHRVRSSRIRTRTPSVRTVSDTVRWISTVHVTSSHPSDRLEGTSLSPSGLNRRCPGLSTSGSNRPVPLRRRNSPRPWIGSPSRFDSTSRRIGERAHTCADTTTRARARARKESQADDMTRDLLLQVSERRNGRGGGRKGREEERAADHEETQRRRRMCRWKIPNPPRRTHPRKALRTVPSSRKKDGPRSSSKPATKSSTTRWPSTGTSLASEKEQG